MHRYQLINSLIVVVLITILVILVLAQRQLVHCLDFLLFLPDNLLFLRKFLLQGPEI